MASEGPPDNFVWAKVVLRRIVPRIFNQLIIRNFIRSCHRITGAASLPDRRLTLPVFRRTGSIRSSATRQRHGPATPYRKTRKCPSAPHIASTARNRNITPAPRFPRQSGATTGPALPAPRRARSSLTGRASDPPQAMLAPASGRMRTLSRPLPPPAVFGPKPLTCLPLISVPNPFQHPGPAPCGRVHLFGHRAQIRRQNEKPGREGPGRFVHRRLCDQCNLASTVSMDWSISLFASAALICLAITSRAAAMATLTAWSRTSFTALDCAEAI